MSCSASVYLCLCFLWEVGEEFVVVSTHDKNVDLPHPGSPNNKIVDVALSSWVPCESAIAIESIKVLF